MPIQMHEYKMIYKDQVFNVLSICPEVWEEADNMENKVIKVKFIQAIYIDENGEVKTIRDEAFMFKFVRR